MINRFYYTMADLMDNESASNPDYVAASGDSFADVFAPVFAEISNSSPEIDTLFQQYIWPRFANQSIGYIDVIGSPYDFGEPTEPTLEDIKDSYNYKQVVGNIAAWLSSSSEVYTKLIQLYNTEKDNLMNSLSSTSETNDDFDNDGNDTHKVNNTPQIVNGIETDAYASQINLNNNHGEGRSHSKTTTSVDTETVIARLDEISNKLYSVYKKWSDEFRKFIIY